MSSSEDEETLPITKLCREEELIEDLSDNEDNSPLNITIIQPTASQLKKAHIHTSSVSQPSHFLRESLQSRNLSFAASKPPPGSPLTFSVQLEQKKQQSNLSSLSAALQDVPKELISSSLAFAQEDIDQTLQILSKDETVESESRKRINDLMEIRWNLRLQNEENPCSQCTDDDEWDGEDAENSTLNDELEDLFAINDLHEIPKENICDPTSENEFCERVTSILGALGDSEEKIIQFSLQDSSEATPPLNIPDSLASSSCYLSPPDAPPLPPSGKISSSPNSSPERQRLHFPSFKVDPSLESEYKADQTLLRNQILGIKEEQSVVGRAISRLFKRKVEEEKTKVPFVNIDFDHVPYDPNPQRAFLGMSKANINLLSITRYGTIIENVLSPTLAQRFLNRWKSFIRRFGKDSPYAKVELCFHGTSTVACSSIVKQGLLVPGWLNGVSKLNGSAYGKGIYCSPDPCTARGYARGRLLVLAVLPGKPSFHDGVYLNLSGYDSRQSGTIWVIFRPSQVLPLYAIYDI